MSESSLLDPNPSPETLADWSTHLGYPVTDADALRQELSSGPSLPQAFAAVARRYPDANALTIDGMTLTHRQVDVQSRRTASALRDFGVGAGSPVAIVADTDLSVVIAYLGALRTGAVVTFVDGSYTAIELARVLRAANAGVALATGASLQRLAEAGLGLATIGLKESDRAIIGEVLTDRQSPGLEPVIDPGSTAILAFTSGSTGEPKPVPLSHRNLLSSIRGALGAWRWTADERLVHSLPIGHQHGLGGIHAALLTGSHTVVLARFDPDLLIDTLGTEGASALFAVPSIYERLTSAVPERMGSLTGLRLMISGSAPLSPELALQVEELTGQLPLERYGSTEAGLDVSNPYEGPRIPGTVGLALPGVELALVGSSGDPVDTEETGEVLVRGPQVFGGYQGSHDDQAFLHGWFRTGDIGIIDEETRHLRLVGRAKELILTGGMNVHPREVEAALLAVPGVTDAAVIGVPSIRWGEAVTAFVVTDGLATSQIIEALGRSLAPFKRPKQIIKVDTIPRTEMGKLRREVLAASVTSDQI
ncbi:MAG: class I adenylate-forming enzyme family protein [Acidimicrobiia bacterium]